MTVYFFGIVTSNKNQIKAVDTRGQSPNESLNARCIRDGLCRQCEKRKFSGALSSGESMLKKFAATTLVRFLPVYSSTTQEPQQVYLSWAAPVESSIVSHWHDMESCVVVERYLIQNNVKCVETNALENFVCKVASISLNWNRIGLALGYQSQNYNQFLVTAIISTPLLIRINHVKGSVDPAMQTNCWLCILLPLMDNRWGHTRSSFSPLASERCKQKNQCQM